MKSDGTPELSDVPGLIEYGRQHRNPPALMQARAALMEACEEDLRQAAAQNRALNSSERRAWDEAMNQAHALTKEIAQMTERDPNEQLRFVGGGFTPDVR